VTGTITTAYFCAYHSTAGTNEAWACEISKNNSGAWTMIQNLAVSASSRTWSNVALSFAVTQGDYVEIRFTNPTWATNPDVSNGITGVIFIQ